MCGTGLGPEDSELGVQNLGGQNSSLPDVASPDGFADLFPGRRPQQRI